VGEDAALDGDFEALTDGVDHAQEAGCGGNAVAGGIDSDYSITGAKEEAIENGGGDSGGRVSGVVGLKAGAEAAGETDGRAKAGDDADFGGGDDEVLHTH